MGKITIKAARVNAGLTQVQLADKLGKNPSTIINWENGNTKISLVDFKNLCSVLKVNEDSIILPTKSS